jgi:hypothetical protein
VRKSYRKSGTYRSFAPPAPYPGDLVEKVPKLVRDHRQLQHTARRLAGRLAATCSHDRRTAISSVRSRHVSICTMGSARSSSSVNVPGEHRAVTPPRLVLPCRVSVARAALRRDAVLITRPPPSDPHLTTIMGFQNSVIMGFSNIQLKAVTCCAMSAWLTRVFVISRLFTTEIPTLEPMLGERP